MSAEEHEQRRGLWRLGLSDAEIAARLGLSAAGVASWRLDLGLPPNHKGQRNLPSRTGEEPVVVTCTREEEHEERVRLLAAGYTDAEIARMRGVTPEAIAMWRRKWGYPANRRSRTADEAIDQAQEPVNRGAIVAPSERGGAEGAPEPPAGPPLLRVSIEEGRVLENNLPDYLRRWERGNG